MEASTAIPSGSLAWMVLRLVDSPCTASELVQRFAIQGARVEIGRAAELLEELAGLGLIRVIEPGKTPAYIRTHLGDQLADSLGNGRDMRAYLAELEQLRTDLFSTVAHELRTPLTAIRTAAGLLLDPNTRAAPDERVQLLQSVERNAERLQRLAEATLELARFRAGQLRLQLRRFDARDLGHDVRMALMPTLDSKGQRLAVAVDTEPTWVFADHRRIDRAVLNLVSNAHKFSEPGSEIRITIRRIGEEVCWEVADDGHGIADDELPMLFERFFISAHDRVPGGIGLGLSLVLTTAQAHGGRVEVDSELGRGSTFRLFVPAAGPPSHAE
jgi:signal transduction histidine kinase